MVAAGHRHAAEADDRDADQDLKRPTKQTVLAETEPSTRTNVPTCRSPCRCVSNFESAKAKPIDGLPYPLGQRGP